MSPTLTNVTTTLRHRRGLTEEAAAAAVDSACRRLRLPTIRAVMEEATQFFEKNLGDNKSALDYRRSRGLEDKTIQNFRLLQ